MVFTCLFSEKIFATTRGNLCCTSVGAATMNEVNQSHLLVLAMKISEVKIIFFDKPKDNSITISTY